MTDRDPMELRGLLPGGSDHPSARVQGRSALSAMEREVMDLGRSAERELGVVGRRLEAGAEGALHGAEMGAERALHGAEWLAGRVARVGGDVGITLLQGEKDLVRRILQSHAHGKRLAIALLAALLAVGVIQFGWPDVWNIAQSLPITVSVLVITVAAFIAGVLVPEESTGRTIAMVSGSVAMLFVLGTIVQSAVQLNGCLQWYSDPDLYTPARNCYVQYGENWNGYCQGVITKTVDSRLCPNIRFDTPTAVFWLLLNYAIVTVFTITAVALTYIVFKYDSSNVNRHVLREYHRNKHHRELQQQRAQAQQDVRVQTQKDDGL